MTVEQSRCIGASGIRNSACQEPRCNFDAAFEGGLITVDSQLPFFVEIVFYCCPEPAPQPRECTHRSRLPHLKCCKARRSGMTVEQITNRLPGCTYLARTPLRWHCRLDDPQSTIPDSALPAGQSSRLRVFKEGNGRQASPCAARLRGTHLNALLHYTAYAS